MLSKDTALLYNLLKNYDTALDKSWIIIAIVILLVMLLDLSTFSAYIILCNMAFCIFLLLESFWKCYRLVINKSAKPQIFIHIIHNSLFLRGLTLKPVSVYNLSQIPGILTSFHGIMIMFACWFQYNWHHTVTSLTCLTSKYA